MPAALLLPHPAPGAAGTAAALARLRRRVMPAANDENWSPPPLPDLIARIDAALAQRRGF